MIDSDPMALQAEVVDLSRRIAVLEVLMLGGSQETPDPRLLLTLYLDAAKGPIYDPVSARHWERQIYLCDARTFLAMARLTRDPLPWQPFLYLLDLYCDRDYPLDGARQHLLSVAQDLLDLQGLKKIHPRDVMSNPLRIKIALAAISRRSDVHDQPQAGP